MMEIFYWPFLDLVIWGFITVYLMKFQGSIPGAVTFFLGALILWDVLFRSQQGITISFLEEIWARNLMNLFASPLKPSEFLAATMAMSLFKVTAVSIVMSVCALVFYSYNVFMIGMWLAPFVVNLVLTGWIIGVLTTSLIMRFGQEAEVAEVQVPVFRLMTLCAVASFCTRKVSEPGVAPFAALAETEVEELVAFVGVQASGVITASAAARTAAKVVLTVR